MSFDFDYIWQKYSKYSRIEFARFIVRVGLLFFYQLFLFQTAHQDTVYIHTTAQPP